jgi:manganese oxidase
VHRESPAAGDAGAPLVRARGWFGFRAAPIVGSPGDGKRCARVGGCRLGVVDPEGLIFALRDNVVSKIAGGDVTPGNVAPRPDKRPRPLTLRMNVGDCLTINFQNLLGPAAAGHLQTRSAGISVLGMQLKGSIISDGSNVGQNATPANPTAGLVPPGGTATYTFYGEREGAYELYSPSDTVSAEGVGVLAHGLFGAINVEPTGAEWYRSQVSRDDMDLATVGLTADGHPIIDYDARFHSGPFAGKPILKMLDAGEIVYSDLTAVITGPGRGNFGQGGSPAYPPNASEPNRNEPFREFTIVFHDENAVVQAFETFADPNFLFTLHGVRDGKSINYGSGGVAAEVLANRFGVGPTANCAECKLEEFFLTSWALGDPAQIVDIPANTGCAVDCTGAQGPKATKAFYPDDPSNVYHTYINDHTKFRNVHVGKEHHIFHLHSHQWLKTPDDDNSQYLDAQAIGPGASYTYEIVFGGSGNRNKTPGRRHLPLPLLPPLRPRHVGAVAQSRCLPARHPARR